MNSLPYIVGLTGGIATGKSTFCVLLKRLYPEVVVFDSDKCVRSIYEETHVISEITAYFGREIILPDGTVNKSLIRERVFNQPEDKKFLESIFHPFVRKECLALLSDTCKRNESRLFVADVPLLFESGFDFGQSANLLVATSKQTQIKRLTNRNVWEKSIIEAVIASQLSIDAKLTMADMVFWNEGTVEILEAQCKRYLRSLDLRSHY
ncbi:MAG: dephospho-CoA kinase [Akkermansiaceae bacterium]